MNTVTHEINDEMNLDLKALRADILALKQDVKAALTHLKEGAVNGAHSASAHLAGKANELSENLSMQSEQAIKSLSKQIEQQPFGSVLIAFSTGFLLSRFIPR